MVSRIMINLRDPTLRRPVDRDEVVSTSQGGCLSTPVLDDSLNATTAGTLSESNP